MLKSYHYDRQKKQFQVSWTGKEVICYLPFMDYQFIGNGVLKTETVKKQQDSVYVKITSEQAGEMSVVIRNK